MELEIVESIEGLEALRDEWNRLTDEPLMSWDWNYSWWRHMGDDFRLRIVVARKEGIVRGIAPFMVESRSGETCLRFIGSGNTCTDYARVIAKDNHVEPMLQMIADEINSEHGRLNDVSLVELEGVCETIEESGLLNRIQDKFWAYQKSLESSWVILLEQSWEQFVSGQNKSLRRKIRKAEKRFAKGEAVVKSTRHDLEYDEAFNILVDLHQKRFNFKGEPGVFADERFTGFLYDAGKALSARGKAEIVVCEVQGKPIVSHFYLNSPSGLQMYQSGICEQSMRYEPGHLLFTHTVHRSISEGRTSFDFLRGDEPYKQFWGAVEIPLYLVRGVSNRLPFTFKHQLIRGARHVKSMLKAAKNSAAV